MVAWKLNCYPKIWKSKQHFNQKWDKLWDKLIYVIIEGGWHPLAFTYRANVTFASWAWCCIKTPQLAIIACTTLTTNTSLVVLQTLKQITQYNKYCIWILKPRIQIKFNMALLETYRPWIIFESWYCVKSLISLCTLSYLM